MQAALDWLPGAATPPLLGLSRWRSRRPRPRSRPRHPRPSARQTPPRTCTCAARPTSPRSPRWSSPSSRRCPGLQVTVESWNTNDLYEAAAATCRSGRPEADLLMSSAVDQFVALVNDGCALPHQSAQTAALPASRNWRNELFGVTREPAVIIYNRDLVSPGRGAAVPLRPHRPAAAGGHPLRRTCRDLRHRGVGRRLPARLHRLAAGDDLRQPDRGLRPHRRRRHLLLGRDHRRRRRRPLPDRLQRARLLRDDPRRRRPAHRRRRARGLYARPQPRRDDPEGRGESDRGGALHRLHAVGRRPRRPRASSSSSPATRRAACPRTTPRSTGRSG